MPLPITRIQPELLIIGYTNLDPVSRVLIGSDKLGEASIETNYSDGEEYVMGGMVTTKMPDLLSIRITAETRPDTENSIWYTSGRDYPEALARLHDCLPLLGTAAERTHAKVADIVADALEVDDNDEVVQKIARAIMAAGVI